MERHEALDKLPQAEMVGMPRRSDGVDHALRQTFAPVNDDVFRGLLDRLDRNVVNQARGG